MKISFLQIIHGISDNYPMQLDRLISLKHGRSQATTARYLAYKMLADQGYTIKDIAAYFDAKQHNVAKKLKLYSDWLRMYPEMQANHERVKDVVELAALHGFLTISVSQIEAVDNQELILHHTP